MCDLDTYIHQVEKYANNVLIIICMLSPFWEELVGCGWLSGGWLSKGENMVTELSLFLKRRLPFFLYFADRQYSL